MTQCLQGVIRITLLYCFWYMDEIHKVLYWFRRFVLKCFQTTYNILENVNGFLYTKFNRVPISNRLKLFVKTFTWFSLRFYNQYIWVFDLHAYYSHYMKRLKQFFVTGNYLFVASPHGTLAFRRSMALRSRTVDKFDDMYVS